MKDHMSNISIAAAADLFSRIKNILNKIYAKEKEPSEEAIAARKRFDRANRISRSNIETKELFDKYPQLKPRPQGGSARNNAVFHQREVRIGVAKEHWFATD